MYVAAHANFEILLVACVAVTSLVAYRWGRLNWAIFAAWGLLIVHFLAGALVIHEIQSLPPPAADHTVWLRPPGLNATPVYLGAFAGALLALVVGLSVSAWSLRHAR